MRGVEHGELEMEAEKFKKVVIKFFLNERSSRSMTMKKFATLMDVSASTVYKRETEGLSDFMVLCETLEKLGYEPFTKLNEFRIEAFRK